MLIEVPTAPLNTPQLLQGELWRGLHAAEGGTVMKQRSGIGGRLPTRFYEARCCSDQVLGPRFPAA
jgi:hypothetical protein